LSRLLFEITLGLTPYPSTSIRERFVSRKRNHVYRHNNSLDYLRCTIYCRVYTKSNGNRSEGKGKAIPLRPITGPEGSRKLRLPDFETVGTWRRYRPSLPPENILSTQFCCRLIRPQRHSAAVMNMWVKIPVNLWGFEPATFLLLALCLN